MRTAVVNELSELHGHAAAWDSLAVASSQPLCAPAWMLSWWRHAPPPSSQLSCVLVWDRDRLIGLAPWFLTTDRFGVRTVRHLADEISHDVHPLAVAGREREVAAQLAHALHSGRVPADLVSFRRLDARSVWPSLLAEESSGGARPVLRYSQPALAVAPAGRGFEGWLASKSANFRADVRRKHRAIRRAGGSFRLSDESSLEADLRQFARLHRARWGPRGGSSTLTPGVPEMLREAGRDLLAAGRLRVWNLEIDGMVISSTLAVSAGGEHLYWLTGFDESHRSLSPGFMGVIRMVQDAIEAGAARIDLAAGDDGYKRRIADAERELRTTQLVLPTARAAAWGQVLYGRGRRIASARLPPAARRVALTLEQRVRAR